MLKQISNLMEEVVKVTTNNLEMKMPETILTSIILG